jgi:biopolymer transport protein ExbD
MAGGAMHDADEGITGINVTPLVDITLVLLIIFMVTTKIVLNQTVPLDLPKAATGTSDVQIVFSIVLVADGRVMVDGKLVPNDDAILALARDAQAQHADMRAVIKADSAVTHGRVIHVLDLLKQAHVSKIAFGVTPTALAPQPLAPPPLAPPPLAPPPLAPPPLAPPQ